MTTCYDRDSFLNGQVELGNNKKISSNLAGFGGTQQ